jgi:hypothetical protein
MFENEWCRIDSYSIMTAEEFKAKREQLVRGARKRTLVLLLILLLTPLLSLLTVSWVQRQEDPVYGLKIGLLTLAMTLVVGGGYGYVLATAFRRRSERDGMICPGCKKPFAFSGWVLATGNCCKCGTRLVELELRKEVGAFSRDDVLQRWRKKKREENRYGIPIAGLFLLSLAGAAAYIGLRRIRPEWEKLDGFVVGALIVIGLGSACIGLFIQHRLTKELGLRCPHCNGVFGEPNRSQVVVASGNCGFCGGVILKGEPRSRGQIKREEFLARRQKFERQQTWANVCMFGALVAACVAVLVMEAFFKRHTEAVVWEKAAVATLWVWLLATICLPIIHLVLAERKLGMPCQKCGKQMFRCSQAVMATGNCGFCGEMVIFD